MLLLVTGGLYRVNQPAVTCYSAIPRFTPLVQYVTSRMVSPLFTFTWRPKTRDIHPVITLGFYSVLYVRKKGP